jgi:hypothetical protein
MPRRISIPDHVVVPVPDEKWAFGGLELTGYTQWDPSSSDSARIRYNSVSGRIEVSEAGSTYSPIVSVGDDAGSHISVATIAALSAYDDGYLPDGATASMSSLLDDWSLRRSSTEAVDGITCIAANSGFGRWVRKCSAHKYWSIQDAWYIAYTTGNDEDPGTQSNPIKTLEEWQRRIGSYLDHIGVVTVNIVEDLHQETMLRIPTTRFDMSGPLVFQGILQASNRLYAGSVSAYQALNPATNTESLLTDVAVSGWAAHGLVGKMLVMVSGAASGCVAWPLNAEGAGDNTTRVNRFFNPSTFGYADPAPGDTFQVYQPIRVTGNGFLNINGGIEIWFKYLAIEPGGAQAAEEWSGESQYLCCSVNDGKVYTLSGTQWWMGCLFDNPVTVSNGGGEMVLWSCSAINAEFSVGGSFGVGMTSVFDYLIAYGDGTSHTLFYVLANSMLDCQAAVGVWNYDASFPIILGTQGKMNLHQTGRLFGVTNAGYCITLEPGCCLVYDPATLSNMTGAQDHDVYIAGTEKDWGELPFSDAAKMAGAVSL